MDSIQIQLKTPVLLRQKTSWICVKVTTHLKTIDMTFGDKPVLTGKIMATPSPTPNSIAPLPRLFVLPHRAPAHWIPTHSCTPSSCITWWWNDSNLLLRTMNCNNHSSKMVINYHDRVIQGLCKLSIEFTLKLWKKRTKNKYNSSEGLTWNVVFWRIVLK